MFDTFEREFCFPTYWPHFVRGFSLPKHNDSSISSSLLYRAQQSDDMAWTKLNQLYFPLIHQWIRTAGVAAADADDIAQQVLFQVHRNIQNFSRDGESGSFTGWVWTTTKFKIRDHFNEQNQEPKATGGSMAAELIHQMGQNEKEIFDEASATVRLTRQLLEMIKAEFQSNTWDAFWRTAVEGERAADVAGDMGLTIQAVYKAKSRVLRRVREELDGILDPKESLEF